MQLIEHPEAVDHSPPEVVVVVVDVVYKAQSHAGVEVLMGDGVDVSLVYLNIGHDLFGGSLFKAILIVRVQWVLSEFKRRVAESESFLFH